MRFAVSHDGQHTPASRAHTAANEFRSRVKDHDAGEARRVVEAIDGLIELIIAAPDREQLIMRTRALDRVLLWNHFVIPQYHNRSFRIVYWDKLGHPAKTPKYGLAFDAWWVDQGKDRALRAKQEGKK